MTQVFNKANTDNQIMKAEDLDIVGSLFGLRFVGGGSPPGCVELYIEDDENYFLKTTFNVFWLRDLVKVTTEAYETIGPIELKHTE